MLPKAAGDMVPGFASVERSRVLPVLVRAYLPVVADSEGKETIVLELLIVVLVVLWLLGYFGPTRIPRIPQTGGLVHVLLVIILILIIVRLL
jgi:Family of unknown function (DUF5670)